LRGGDGAEVLGEQKIGLNWMRRCVVFELGVGRVTCQFFSRFSDFVACDQSEVLKLQCAPIENFGEKFEGLKKE
jgi:hypothetical protein